jgi:hypothetical protein
MRDLAYLQFKLRSSIESHSMISHHMQQGRSITVPRTPLASCRHQPDRPIGVLDDENASQAFCVRSSEVIRSMNPEAETCSPRVEG